MKGHGSHCLRVLQLIHFDKLCFGLGLLWENIIWLLMKELKNSPGITMEENVGLESGLQCSVSRWRYLLWAPCHGAA